MFVNFFAGFLVAFGFAILLAPFVISFLKKQKAKQVILHYVEAHAKKSGTPTMGGIIFLFAAAGACAIFFSRDSKLAVMCLAVMFAYALLGFLDDFLKVKFKQNLGLKMYQKLLFQLAVATIISIYVYKSEFVGSEIEIPFMHKSVDFGWGIIPFTIFVFLACTNSVNLTDGLDGLASLTTIIYLLCTCVLISILSAWDGGAFSKTVSAETQNIIIFSLALSGGLLGFLWFNSFPAKIFMGDTGSMALGAAVACVAIFTKASLFIPLFGLVFVASSVSDIIQVAYYKRTKKRVFLMAPLHHHFEKKGVHESKIVACYAIVTATVGLLTLLIQIV